MKSASPDITILFGRGSPLVDVTDWITSDITLGGQGIYEDTTPYGATATVNTPVGVTEEPDIVLEGLYDDLDNGPQDVFGTISTAADADTPYTIQVGLVSGSPASSASKPVHIKAFEVLTKVKGVTRFRVTLTSAGATTFVRQGA